METRDLEYLLAIGSHGGIGRAADALGISQPALTKAVRRIETQLGLPLFERTAQGMRPTDAGAAFLQRAQRIRLEYDDALKEMREMRTGELGLLRIGYSPSMPNPLVLGACQQLLRERPVARLRLVRRLAPELMDLLVEGGLDIAIAPVPSRQADRFAARELFHDSLAVIADEDHPLQHKRGLTLADLVGQPWLLPEAHIVLRQQVEAAFHAAGLPPPMLRIEADFGSASLLHLLRGTSLLSVGGALMNRGTMGLRPLPLPPEQLDLRRRVGAVWRKGAYLSPLAQRMIEILQQGER